MNTATFTARAREIEASINDTSRATVIAANRAYSVLARELLDAEAVAAVRAPEKVAELRRLGGAAMHLQSWGPKGVERFGVSL